MPHSTVAQSKMPSAVPRSIGAVRGRSLPYVIGNPRSKLALPMALGAAPTSSDSKKPAALMPPGQPTTCIAYAFQPAQGQEAILLIPTTALKFELRDQAGQKVLQFLPPSATFLPLVKTTVKPPASSTAIAGQQPHHDDPVAAIAPAVPKKQTTLASSATSTNDKTAPASTSATTVVKPSFRFQERPVSWKGALRLDFGGEIYSGEAASIALQPNTSSDNKMEPVKAIPGREDIEEEKRKAYVRYGSNNELIKKILDERVVVAKDESAWPDDSSSSRKEHISWLASKVRSALVETEQTRIRLQQKTAEVSEANDLFRYKLVRFQQLAALMNSDEFHKATVEAELEQMQNVHELALAGTICAL